MISSPTSASRTYLFNSLVAAGGSAIVSVVLGSMCAYSLSRIDFSGKSDLFFWIISTRMAPVVAVMVPLYWIFRELDLVGTLPGLILAYTTFNLPFAIWILKGFFDNVPYAIEEAQMVDGATRFQAFRAILPLVAPGIGAFLVLCILFAWNDFLFAAIIGSGGAKTLPVATRELVQPQNIQWGQIMAAGVVTTLPMMFLGSSSAAISSPASPWARSRNSRSSTMAKVSFRNVWKKYGDVRRREGPQHRVPGRLVPVDPWALGLRQVLDHAHGGGPGAHHRRPDPVRREADQRTGAQGPRRRHGVRELRALSAQERVREHGQPAEAARPGRRPDQGAGHGGRKAAGDLRICWSAARRNLSGGQKQRVAIGRAIVREPKLFLFDEPIAHLDAKLRAHMRGEIKHLQRTLGTTMIYVTHDQLEAMSMADTIAVMHDGELQQLGTPREVYNKPVNAWVAGFVGEPAMNFMDASDRGQGRAHPFHASELLDRRHTRSSSASSPPPRGQTRCASACGPMRCRSRWRSPRRSTSRARSS